MPTNNNVETGRKFREQALSPLGHAMIQIKSSREGKIPHIVQESQ